jgi:hypothetical protein
MIRRLGLGLVAVVVGVWVVWMMFLTTPGSRELARELVRIDTLLRAVDEGGEGRVLALRVRVLEAEGLPRELVGKKLGLALRWPDGLRIEVEVDGDDYLLGRDGEAIWLAVPHRGLALLGENSVPRFAADPGSVELVELPALASPLARWQLPLLAGAVRVDRAEGGRLWQVRPRALVARVLGLPEELALVYWGDGQGGAAGLRVEIGEAALALALEEVRLHWPGAGDAPVFGLAAGEGQQVERVALAHLVRFAGATRAQLGAEIPELGEASGQRRLLARHGAGRLEEHDGTKVLFLKGSPEQMGEQHGVLLRDEVHQLVDRILYGVGVGSTFAKGRWFFGEIEEAQARLEPFIDGRALREMDALADAAGLHRQELRLANFFPELFHCSGFALHGSATVGERMFHGRVLDYLRGMGLEENAVVMVVEPDEGYAWVNVGYAGFTGTVTAMNERQVAIGEMGGRGEGDWDGRPMAQLMREVMERAGDIDEALEIMRAAPRTCEYFYVISDAKTMRAVGIKATPEIFDTVWSGEAHPLLPQAVEDAVVLSAEKRYEHLVERVLAGHGRFDEAAARDLMLPPVCMSSNIQSVLFAPCTLDFWVANADSDKVASLARYTRYNLRELLEGEPALP